MEKFSEDEKSALYAGSFDPITKGHLWVIKRAVKLFDHLYIGVASNPNKKTYLTIEERVSMIKGVLNEYGLVRVSVIPMDTSKFTVSLMKEKNIKWFIRGIRNSADFEYENSLIQINNDIADKEDWSIETLFFTPPNSLSNISSSMVRGLLPFKGWRGVIKEYVDESVYLRLLKKELVDRYHISTNKSKDLEKYFERGRYYHNIEHIYNMCEEFEELLNGKIFNNKPLIIESILYHDLFYDSMLPDRENVQLSIDYYRGVFNDFYDKNWKKNVVELIETTDYSKGKRSILTDLDLSILGKPEKEYDLYCEKIRKEYAWVEESLYCKERIKILENISSKPIYENQYFIDKYEVQAKKNIEREIVQLKSKLK